MTEESELGGRDPEDYNKKKIADERRAGHFSNKKAHKERGDANKNDPKRS